MESKVRSSNIELFRIFAMICIIAHHYVVNSDLTELMDEAPLTINSLFLTFFGGGGKIGINCFVLITGYYMCTSSITLKKFLKLFLVVEFYKIVFYFIFLFTGYIEFSTIGCLQYIFPITGIRTGFTFSFLAFYLFIPYINKLIHAMSQKEHKLLLGILLFIYTVLPSLKIVKFSLDYVIWFVIIYLLASYIRLYPSKLSNQTKFWALGMICTIILAYISELLGIWLGMRNDDMSLRYFFVADSNKLLALIVAVCSFMFFKNLKLNYHKWINTIAATSFGVLMIHANSDAMRQWLWKDLLKNTEMFTNEYLFVHAVVSVVGVFCVCALIDWMRIRLFETPFLKAFDKFVEKKEWYNAKETMD